MTSPRVEIGGIGMAVVGVGEMMEVEDELVGREEHATAVTLDALSARAVVARRNELTATSPAARVTHMKGEVLR